MKHSPFFRASVLMVGSALSFSFLAFGGCSFARSSGDSPLFGVDVRPSESSLSPAAQKNYAYLVYTTALARGDEKGILEAAPYLRTTQAPASVWLEGAVWLMSNGTQQVLDFCREATTACPDDLSLNLLYAEALGAHGMSEEGIQLMKGYLQRFPDAIDARLEQALLLVKSSRFTEAERILTAITPEQRTPLVNFYHARALIGMKRSDEAIPLLKKAIAKDPNFIEAILELAYLYELRSDLSNARSLYEGLLQKSISPEKIVPRLIRLSLRMGQPEKALSYVKKGPDTEAFKITIAGLFLEERHYLQAEQLLKQVVEEGNPPSDVYLLLADLAYEQRRNLTQATTWLDRIPAQGKDGARALLLRTQLYAQDTRYDQALKFAEQGQKTYPDEVGFDLIAIHIALGKKDKEAAYHAAVAAYQRWSQDEDIAFLYASLLDEQGKKADALRIMEDIIKVNPKNYQALNYIGYTLAEQGKDLDRALQLLRSADEIAPNQPYIIDSVAWALFKKGQHNEAFTEIKRAVTQKGNIDAAIWEHYGDIASAVGNKKEARHGYEKALQLKPENSTAIQQKLQQL